MVTHPCWLVTTLDRAQLDFRERMVSLWDNVQPVQWIYERETMPWRWNPEWPPLLHRCHTERGSCSRKLATEKEHALLWSRNRMSHNSSTPPPPTPHPPTPLHPPKKREKKARIIVHRLGTASSGTDAFGRCTFRTLMSCPLGLPYTLLVNAGCN